MSTTNVSVTNDWVKVADDTDDPILVQCAADIEWQAAAMATETPPSVEGHALMGRGQLISRDNLGTGFVYVRTIGVDVNPVTFIVTK